MEAAATSGAKQSASLSTNPSCQVAQVIGVVVLRAIDQQAVELVQKLGLGIDASGGCLPNFAPLTIEFPNVNLRMFYAGDHCDTDQS
jgi:hypothetical protein